MTPRQRRLLQSLAKGDCPRCSKREFYELQQLPGMVTALQLESAHGADTRSGYSLAPLHNGEATTQAIDALLGGTPVAAAHASQKTKRPATKRLVVGELTRKEFAVIAKVMQSEAPAKDAAFLVLVKGQAIKDAVTTTGMLQPAVSRTVRRYRDWHTIILSGYAKRASNA